MSKRKVPRSYRLDDAVIERLEWLAGQSRRSKSSVLELLIINARPETLGLPRYALETVEEGEANDGE